MKYDRTAQSNSIAKWLAVGAASDMIWASCSNCSFTEQAWKVVKFGKENDKATFTEAIYKFCPICGKPMDV